MSGIWLAQHSRFPDFGACYRQLQNTRTTIHPFSHMRRRILAVVMLSLSRWYHAGRDKSQLCPRTVGPFRESVAGWATPTLCAFTLVIVYWWKYKVLQTAGHVSARRGPHYQNYRLLGG